jgi:hypothetical protein
MKVTYAPEGAEPQVWDWDPDKVTQSQAEMIEKRHGGRWDAFTEDVRAGGARARRVLLWHLQRQTHHTLRYEDTPDFRMGDLRLEFDLDELALIRDRVMKSDLSDQEKEGVLLGLDIELTERMGEAAVDEPTEVEPGKAPEVEASPTSA